MVAGTVLGMSTVRGTIFILHITINYISNLPILSGKRWNSGQTTIGQRRKETFFLNERSNDVRKTCFRYQNKRN